VAALTSACASGQKAPPCVLCRGKSCAAVGYFRLAPKAPSPKKAGGSDGLGQASASQPNTLLGPCIR
jgi:hypothetical protein